MAQWVCFEPDIPTSWSEGDFRAFVETGEWVFARTMPQNPHEYTLRRDHSDEVFEEAVRYVRQHGQMEEFWRKPYKVLHLDDFMFWTMGAELEVTILINRKPTAAAHL